MAAKKAVAKSKIVKKVPKIKKVYTEDGLIFKSFDMLTYYQELKELKRVGVINNFDVPTIKQQTAEMKKHKFNAVRVMIDDHVFPSKLESRFYAYLKKEKASLNIKSFNIQVVFELQPKFKKMGKIIRPITYIPDYEIVYNDGNKIYIDTKGRVTEEFKIKQKMFNFKFPDLTLVCLNYDEKEKRWYDIAEKKTKGKKK